MRAGDILGSEDVLSPSETLHCYNNNAERSCKVGQQKELWRAGALKGAMEMEGCERFTLFWWEDSAPSWRTEIVQEFNEGKAKSAG